MSDAPAASPPPGGQFLLYQTEDGKLKIDVRFEGETVWLTQQHMAELFRTTKQNVGQHLKKIFEEGELGEISVVKNFFTTAADGKRYATNFYNLDAIISVGYRVKSAVATRFRIWATQRLREYIVKGFTMDDERLKNPDQLFDYFEEQLERIRDSANGATQPQPGATPRETINRTHASPERAAHPMPQSLARLQIHLVFSTKNRAPLLRDPVRDALHRYMAVVLQNLGCPASLINSVEDHVHVLFELSRTVAVSDAVEEVKKSSSKWIKTQDAGLAGFAWQAGYGAFAVSESNVAAVRAYIAGQREHHRRKSFQEEYRALLDRHGVAFDERYVWD